MKGKTEVIRMQKAWANSNGIVKHELNSGYAKNIEYNLFNNELSEEAKKEFEMADGYELKDSKIRPAKIKAFHSSSALAYNFFEYWRHKDKSVLTKSLGIKESKLKTLRLEEVLNTGISKPNIDVFLVKENKESISIESKFCEWMDKSDKGIKPSYFKDGNRDIKRWEDLGLPNCQNIAEKIKNRTLKFNRLDAPQLLKHALGIAKKLDGESELLYIYFDLEDENSRIRNEHKDEVECFSEMIGNELKFRCLTYQNIFKEMIKYRSVLNEEYLRYVQERYLI